MTEIWLECNAPICSFRVPRAREYAESFLVPPPSTVYGMLLALVGEWNTARYAGTELALAFLAIPEKSRLLRLNFRFKNKKLLAPCNFCPNFKEVITGLHFWIGIRGHLAIAIHNAFANPEQLERLHGLSLGENHDLIDSISIVGKPPEKTLWLVRSSTGSLCLPYWVDHATKLTLFQRYSLAQNILEPEQIFTKIQP